MQGGEERMRLRIFVVLAAVAAAGAMATISGISLALVSNRTSRTTVGRHRAAGRQRRGPQQRSGSLLG